MQERKVVQAGSAPCCLTMSLIPFVAIPAALFLHCFLVCCRFASCDGRLVWRRAVGVAAVIPTAVVSKTVGAHFVPEGGAPSPQRRARKEGAEARDASTYPVRGRAVGGSSPLPRGSFRPYHRPRHGAKDEDSDGGSGHVGARTPFLLSPRKW